MDQIIGDHVGSEGANSGGTKRTFEEVEGFGSNPGNLRMHLYVPHPGNRQRPLVVVLHGCTQTIRGFDRGSGWSRLARDYDFLVLMPEQQSDNNQQTCFSWFQPEDTTRGSGEVESIRQMVEQAIADHDVDRSRIFICGLSAGGAMAAAVLATSPDLFSGGAIIAGLPYGTAGNLAEALESMQIGRTKDARIWGDSVRGASAHKGPWPAISIWHGTTDNVVKPINAGELAKQWTNVHEIGATTPTEDQIGTTSRRVWRDDNGRACVRQYSVPGLGHGVPVATSDPPAPFFLPAGISATRVIARDWGLTDVPAKGRRVFRTAFWRRPS